MTKAPEAYPFLRIAKEYKVPYADVLILAHSSTHGCELPGFAGALFGSTPALLREIVYAVRVQENVRTGKIDWNTGKPL